MSLDGQYIVTGGDADGLGGVFFRDTPEAARAERDRLNDEFNGYIPTDEGLVRYRPWRAYRLVEET